MSTNFDKFAILDSFIDEVSSYLPEIASNLDRLQQRPDDEEAIEETYRRAHTIGGSAAMMGFSALAHVAQGMEAILGNALDGTARLDGPTIALLRRSSTRLGRLLELVRTDADGSQILAEDDADHAASRGDTASAFADGASGVREPTGPVSAVRPATPPPSAPQMPDWLGAFAAPGGNGGNGGDGAPVGNGYPRQPEYGGGPANQPSMDDMIQSFRATPTGPVPVPPNGGYPGAAPQIPQGPQMPPAPGYPAPGYAAPGYPAPSYPAPGGPASGPASPQTPQGYQPGGMSAPPSGGLPAGGPALPGARPDPFAGSGIFDLPPELEMDGAGEPDTAHALIAISPAWEVLANSEDALQQHVRFLRDIIGALREAAQAMDDERAELRTFLDGSKDAIDRLEDWAGQAMGLDLRHSPEQVRRYLPLSVVWVTTTRLKKLVSLLNGSGRRLNTFQNDLSEALRSLHVSINNVGRLYSSVAAAASTTAHPNGDGGFTATLAQVTQLRFQPGAAPTASPADQPTGPISAVRPVAPSPAALPPGARAELERQVRDELRAELEDEVRGEIAAQVREEETTRLRHQVEIEIRRQVLAELSPGLGASAAPPASFVVSQPTEATPVVPPALPSIPLTARVAEPMRVTDQSAETLEVFREEAEEHLQNIALGIRELEADPSNKAALQAVRRATHTLKGAAGMMGFAAIEHLSHASEDLLDRLMAGSIRLTPEVQGLLLDSSETLEHLLAGTGQPTSEDNRELASLQQRYDRMLGGAAPTLVSSGPLAPSYAAAPVVSAPSLPSGTSGPLAAGDGLDAGGEADLTVRLRLSKLDEIINLFGDLLQNRAILEERIGRMSTMVGDASRASERLQEIGGQLETRFEAATLPSGPGGPQALPPAVPNLRDRTLGGVQPPRAPGSQAHLSDFDELELDRYTEFHRLSRGLSEGVTDMVTLSNEMESLLREIEGVFARESRLNSSFQDRLLKARLVPLQLMVPRLYRSTRAAAIKQGKEVEFLVQGGDTEVDRTVYEEVAGPLLHIVRNAVAHGIERPGERLRAGKAAAGKIILSATEQNNQVVITVRDDGAGIDTQRITSIAISRGLIPPTTVLTPQQAQNLIFQPGFSTSETIDEESGRGVGLDVVKDAITRMRGTVEINSDQGRGTIFTLRIPVSLQITRAVLVRLGPQTFAIPMNVIEQIGRLDYYERVNDRNGPAVEVRGAVYPLTHLASYLGLPPSRVEERSSLLLYNSGQRRMALLIDAIPNRQEIVVKNLGPHLRDVRGVAGATIGGDGRVVLLLNMDELLASPPAGGVPAPQLPVPNASIPRMPAVSLPLTRPEQVPDLEQLAIINTGMLRNPPPPPPAVSRAPVTTSPRLTTPPAPRPSYVLVVDDSPSVRRVVGNTLKANGWEVQTARDGIEAVEMVGRQMPAAVLLDIEMPRMDGYELMATLRSQPQYKDLPLVVLTSRAATKHQQRALQLGADAYVVKPYQDEDLIGTLDNLISQRSIR